ncbi:MAG: hypothetical protein E7125_04170 [Bacteroidales bacterium]|jgi:hypothetical protein|nr:hypothetical protein [Bacteroidales bacterium]
MKNPIICLLGISLAVLAGCVQDDLSWKELIDAQQEELDAQKAKQEAEALRLAQLKETIDGLKKSDTPFSLVLAEAPADTVSKGLDFTGLIRVNPSGLTFTKEMLALDYISGKQFFRVDPDAQTKASYIKKPDYFSLKNLEVDKNGSGEALNGQYLTTLTTAAEEAVWNDAHMAFVGAYVDKEGKNQLVSSDPFNTVMMPLPAEGLSPWIYPHASFLINEKKKTAEGKEYFEERFGTVYVPLDKVLFKTKDDSDGRYYTPDNLKDIAFVLDEDCTASVKLDYDLKKRYVSFEPDTTANLTWREFKDSTGIKRQEVKGTMVLKDRWGGVSSYHMKMYWYNTNVITLNYEATEQEIKNGLTVDFSEEVKKLGLVYSDMTACRRVLPIPAHHMYNDLAYEAFDDKNPERGELVLYHTPTPGRTYSTNELRSVSVGVSEVDDKFVPITVSFKMVINVMVKANPIDNLTQKLQGKWVLSESEEVPLPTDDKLVYTFLSATKAVSSCSREGVWSPKLEHSVEMDGNTVLLTSHPEEGVTLINRLYVGSITATEMDASWQRTVIRDGKVTEVSKPQYLTSKKVEADFSQSILGLWEGQITSGQNPYDDGKKHRWEYKSNGTFVYYNQADGQWVPEGGSLSEYYVDGNLLCTRWKVPGNEAEYREWWEIKSLENGTMIWTAFRKKADGSTQTESFTLTKVEEEK